MNNEKIIMYMELEKFIQVLKQREKVFYEQALIWYLPNLTSRKYKTGYLLETKLVF